MAPAGAFSMSQAAGRGDDFRRFQRADACDDRTARRRGPFRHLPWHRHRSRSSGEAGGAHGAPPVRGARPANFQRQPAINNQQMLQKGREDNDRRLAHGRAFDNPLRQSTDRALACDRAGQNAIDVSAHASALASLDRQEFRNPSTGERIEADSQFNHRPMLSDGNTVVPANEPSFDPSGQVCPGSPSWTERVPR
jgi:hypothetical protein